MKVAIVSHGHPALGAGGAERAAYSLFEHLKTVPGVQPVFVARAEPRDIGHDAPFGAFRGRTDELLWAPPPYEWFRRMSSAHDVLRRHVQSLVDHVRPDVVHFHHYIFFGLDVIGLFKSLARCRTILTLHEYNLICHHDGQMVKTRDLRLCSHASPAECHACFPEYSAGRFFLRLRLIARQLESVDQFISPSRFLRDRHADWGLDADRISVVENALPPSFHVPAQGSSEARRQDRVRFGFFGQLNPYKGALVLLEAAKYLPSALLDQVEIVLFGANLDRQEQKFQDAVNRAIAASQARVSLFGPYQHADLQTLLRSVDWMVIPSTWWENSPLVIQEARVVGLPILASNIGGMAEKVRDGVDGLHFLAGSALDLAAKIEAIVTKRVSVKPTPLDLPAQNAGVLDAHLNLYGWTDVQRRIAT
ncbi:MAG TPA: glycosyltransferase family 4 protein [Vicinamibacterales bacterium]|nr:glycosyltransferase family 4 protein [Vicinamibacterales bacterium]